VSSLNADARAPTGDGDLERSAIGGATVEVVVAWDISDVDATAAAERGRIGKPLLGRFCEAASELPCEVEGVSKS
jgi:hypothetical protein